MRWDAVIVGSGFGGSVMAARLAERGLRVLVLERGPWWGRGGQNRAADERRDFPRGLVGTRRMLRNIRWAQGGRSRQVLSRVDGLWELHRFDHLLVLTASGVGGGSLVYTNLQVPPDDEFFQAFPDEITAEGMRPFYQRVHAMLRPRAVPLAQRPEKELAFERAVHEAGLGPIHRPELAVAFGENPDVPERVINAAGVEQETCTFRGECVLGCPQGAKTTLDLTYLPLALRHGAELRAFCEAVSVERETQGWGVRYVDHRSKSEGTVYADRVFLCAGTLQSVRLLFETGKKCQMPKALGQHFSGNADHASLIRDIPHVHRLGRGPSIGAFIRLPASTDRQAIVAEMGLPPNLPLPGSLRRSAAVVAMGRERAQGELELRDGYLHTLVGRGLDPELFANIEQVVEELAAGYGARRTFLNVPAGAGKESIATVHPLGGASIGRGPSDGVVDHLGRVFGQPGLYVADGSTLPAAPGVPPAMTIAALAERQAALLDPAI